MNTFNKIMMALAASALAISAQAQVTVSDAWVRATVTQQKATGAFMQIKSIKDARLLEVRSPVAGVAEIHKMEMVGNMMKMRAVDGMDLPAGKVVELRPGAYHIMLLDLKAQVKEGDVVPVTLVVEGKDKKRETIEVKAVVKPLNQATQH
ncbi:MAG: copper chaperone PCu(A)C [Pseudomonadota bacterium]